MTWYIVGKFQVHFSLQGWKPYCEHPYLLWSYSEPFQKGVQPLHQLKGLLNLQSLDISFLEFKLAIENYLRNKVLDQLPASPAYG
jgi:hypothetical protein